MTAALASAAAAWQSFWFAPADPRPLGLVRLGVCAVLLARYLSTLPEWAERHGRDGPVDRQVLSALRAAGDIGPWHQLHWSQWLASDGAVLAVHLTFLGVLLLAAAGWRARWTVPAAWLGHLACLHRAYGAAYGVDSVAAVALLYLSFAPSGAAWSFDARRRCAGASAPSVAANVARRCLQIHLCVIYGAAGLAKLAGAQWWAGVAVWNAAAVSEMWPFGLRPAWLLPAGPWGAAVSNLGSFGSIAAEIAFPFLVWRPAGRRALFVALGIMHVGIALTMGLWQFAAIMMFLYPSFAGVGLAEAVALAAGTTVQPAAIRRRVAA